MKNRSVNTRFLRDILKIKESKMARTFEIVNMPSHDEAMSNYVYVHPFDARAAYVTMGAFVYRCCPHAAIEPGRVALNAIQRRILVKFAGDTVALTDFLIPMRDFTVKAVTVEVEWLKNTDADDPMDLQALANTFRSHHAGHVIAKGQRLILSHKGKMVSCTVKSQVKGLVTMQTEIGVDLHNPAVDVV
jgi:hypothetical protein